MPQCWLHPLKSIIECFPHVPRCQRKVPHLWHQRYVHQFYASTNLVPASGVELDLATMMKYKDKAVTGLTSGIEALFKKNKVCFNQVL